MDNKKHQSREEFEGEIIKELNSAVTSAKQIRNQLRLLENDITKKEEKIRNYQNILSDLQNELVKIQAALYASGTTQHV